MEATSTENPWKPGIGSEAGSLVLREDRQPERVYIRWRMQPSAQELEVHPTCSGGAAELA